MMKREGDIFAQIGKVMRDIEAVGKNRQNEQQRWKFRSIEDIYNTIQPVMAQHDVFTTLRVLDEYIEEITSAKGTKGFYVRNKYQVTFWTKDGSTIDTEAYGEAMDYGDKATNKACSIAHKYALVTMFCIPFDDLPEPDAQCHDVLDGKKQKMIQNFLSIGVTREMLDDECRILCGKGLSGKFNDSDYNKLREFYSDVVAHSSKKPDKAQPEKIEPDQSPQEICMLYCDKMEPAKQTRQPMRSATDVLNEVIASSK